MLRKQIVFGVVFLVAASLLFGSGAFLGFRYGEHYPKTVIVKNVANTANEGTSADFGTFWQAWQLIQDEYLRNASVTDQAKVYGAVRGLVGALHDPYSDFFDPQESDQFQADIRGNFGGIGAEIGMKKDQIVVVAPLKDTPASRAGLLAGDAILKVNSTSTDGLTVDEAVSMIRGPEHSEVTLTVFRKAWEKPKDFHIVREQIQAPTIDFSMKRGNVAYIQLYSFNANSSLLFYQAAVQAVSAGAKGMVLDLRNNPGGYLDVAVDLAGWFLPKGTLVVSEEGRTGVMDELRADGNAAFANFPLIVLVNGGSASAAEILSGALRDDRHTLLVGEQTFGKGTVQQLEPLRDGSSMKITIAHWVLPSGHILENGGLAPDVEVKLTDDGIAQNRDPQLEKALDLVEQQITSQNH